MIDIALNNVENEDKARVDGLLKDKRDLVTKLETDFTDYKDKHEVQVGLVTEKDKKIESLEKQDEVDLQKIGDLKVKQQSLEGERRNWSML